MARVDTYSISKWKIAKESAGRKGMPKLGRRGHRRVNLVVCLDGTIWIIYNVYY